MRSVSIAATCLVLLLAASAVTASFVQGKVRQTGNGVPACDPGVVQHSGYFDINSTENKHYFYWMFEAKQNPSTAPVILWMTGGPGCSSSLAVLAENGPCHMNETSGDLYMNPYSWNNVANVIYIDQPAGVGFSYADFPSGYDTNETMVAHDMYGFLQAFFKAYPKYVSNDFFVYGESYGGHFAPATANRIWQGNNDKEGTPINLKGLSVGNGMTQPEIQLAWYSHLAYDWCNVVKGAPCITESTYNGMVAAIPQCLAMIKTCNANANASGCGNAMQYCLGTQMSPYEATGLNVYDIRKPCIGDLCYPFDKATAFMNRADVQASLGVASQNITWTPCSFNVNGMFNKDWMRDFDQDVVHLLNSGIRVLIYSGDVDFICNWLGNKAWTLQLDWVGKADFVKTRDYPWWLNEMPAGKVRAVSSSSNKIQFAFVQVHDAGHMVPMDQPERALAMVKHFIFDQPFTAWDGPS